MRFPALSAAFFTVLLALSGCSTLPPVAVAPAATPSSPATGRIVTTAQLRVAIPAVHLSDTQYAEVNSRWLEDFYPFFRTQLSHAGVRAWNERFNCKHFAGLYSELAQSRFLLASRIQPVPSDTLAIGSIWYARDDGRGNHAIVVAVTERGLVFIEPQTGQELKLSMKELSSVYLAVL